MAIASTSIELALTLFFGIMLIASFVSIKGKIPYTLILVFIGIALAVLTGPLPFPPLIRDGLLQIRALTFTLIPPGGHSGGLFVGLVVPPLIFEAMMNIRSKDLTAVLRPALFLGTIGVVLATVITGLALWKAAGISFAAAFLFAAVISPTDTATVIGIFQRLRVPSKLSSLLQLEASFNDATAIVIFAVVAGSLTAPQFPVAGAFGSFGLTFGGGLLIGLFMAFVSEILHSLISAKLSETVLSIFAVYGSYTLATGFGFSGLISVAIVGLYFGNFTVKSSMNPETRETIANFWQIAAFIGNSIAFLFIGLETNAAALIPASGFIALAYLTVTLSRVATVYPILTFFSRLGEKIPLKWMNVASLGGVRGALSIALALSLATTTGGLLSSSDVNKVNAMVLGVAFISITAQGGLLYRYVQRRFKEEVSNKDEEELNVRLSRAVTAIQDLQSQRKEGIISEGQFNDGLQTQWSILREAILQMEAIQETREIAKSRASSLYSIIGTPLEKAGDDLFTRPRKLFAKKHGEGRKDSDDSESQHVQEKN